VDGNLILSVRHQDWVIKIDYRSGEGDGHVVWRLGRDGDFTVNSSDPNPWFSHQHNAHYIDGSTLILFDNGNTRRASDPNADSRGQVWRLDEQTMTATLVLNADLGNYSNALGAAQRLSNGNFSFTSGRQGAPPSLFGQTIEVLPDGTPTYVLELAHQEFRSYRIRTLYEGTDDFQGDGDRASPAAGHDGSPGDAPSVAVVNFNNDGILHAGVLMEVTGQAQPNGIDTLAFSTPGFEKGNSLAPFRDAASVEGPMGDQAMRALAARLPASSSRARQPVRERLFADFPGDWLSDALLANMALVG
jgi:hypothetical protein